MVKETLEVQASEFIQTIEQVTLRLKQEDGKIGNLRIKGRLVEAQPEGEAVIVGDLHGDLESLVEILQQSEIVTRIEKSRWAILVFLGDYGDRGPFSAEIYYLISKLKLLRPEQVILMRGNHEGPTDLLPSPHDLPEQLERKFSQKSTEVYAKMREMFEHLYLALLVERRYLMLHGGLPRDLATIDDLAFAHVSHPQTRLLEQILWSDPDDAIEETRISPRGAGQLFGKKVTKSVLTKLNVNVLIRGHESCPEGFKINHDGKALTLFSCKGFPYFNDFGAYLDVNLEKEVTNAQELVPCIHKF